MGEMKYDMEELLPITAWLAEKYTGNDSTSITYEKAEQFMEAVIYCIQEYEMAAGQYELTGKRISAKEAYERGKCLVREKVHKLMDIYHILIADFNAYGNICLEDTVLKGIPEFLKWYDIQFAPQNTIIMLDYPILEDLSGYLGIDKVYRYIKDIYAEQRFLKGLDSGYVWKVLNEYVIDSADMIENICGIVLMDIGRRLPVGKIPNNYLGGESTEDIRKNIRNMMMQFLIKNYGEDTEIINYLEKEVGNTAVRIYPAEESGAVE